jgi:hypothetical protein
MCATPSIALAALLSITAQSACAASDIDVVYGDEMTKRGEWAAELAARYLKFQQLTTLDVYWGQRLRRVRWLTNQNCCSGSIREGRLLAEVVRTWQSCSTATAE